MPQITNYIDLSTNSLMIGLVVFIIATGVSKYLLDLQEKDKPDSEKRNMYLTIFFSILIGLVFSIISLLLFKKFNKYSKSDEIITDVQFPKSGHQ
jgi:ABC-type uncharacterized transport system permease subunit